MITISILTKTRFSMPRAARTESILFLILLLLSFFTIGLAHRTEREPITDPLGFAPLKLGEELTIAKRLHEHPHMARVLAPVMDVPAHLFFDQRTEIVINFNRELALKDIRELENKGVEFHRMENTISHIATIYPVNVPWDLILELARREDVLKIEWGFKKYYPTLERSIPAIGVNKVHAGTNLGKGFSGKGVTIGIVDTGVYWKHPTFWNPDPDYEYLIVAANGQLYADTDRSGDYSSDDKPISFVGPTGQLAEFLQLDEAQFNFGYDYILLGGPKLDPPPHKPSSTQSWPGSFWAIPKDDNGNQKLEEGEHVVGLFNCKIQAFLNDTAGKVAKRQDDGWFHADPTLFRDWEGHGTVIAAIAVGGQLGYSSITGVAPNSDLIISSTTWYLEGMIRELDWVTRQGVDVINLSLGSLFDGPLDGSSLFEQIIDQLFEEQGVLTTVAAGNDHESNLHVLGVLPYRSSSNIYNFVTFDPTSAKLREYFPDYPSGSYFVINALWQGDADLSFRVLTPTGQISLGNYSSPGTGLNPVLNANWTADSNFGQEKRMSRFYAPIMENVTLGSPETGTEFALEVTNPSSKEVKVHIYLSGDRGTITGPLLAHWQNTKAHSGYLVSSPATADSAIAVTSFVTTEWDDAGGMYQSNLIGEISKFASRGPRVDEVNKPNIAAPGELILAAVSRDAYSDVSFADLIGMYGTSMATAHVSGSIALILEAFPEAKKNPTLILDSLYQNVNTESVEKPLPNSIWGIGKLDTYEATRSILESVTTLPTPTKTTQTETGLFVPGFELMATFSALTVTMILLKKKKRRN